MRNLLLAVAVLCLAIPVGQAGHVETDEIRWACGFYGSGHPSACGIDPVGGDDDVDSEGDPAFQPAGPDDWLPGDARVMGVLGPETAKAYPVRMLNSHEIVNDVIDGTPISVTFCPLCGSGLVFERTVSLDGESRETNFTASGYLYSTDMVMWDPVTGQLWNQITGSTIAALEDGRPSADHMDLQLTVLPSTITTWSNWERKHADSLLLQPVRQPGSYRENAYSVTNPENCSHGLSGERDCDDAGLHPKVQVVGHDDGAGGIAFPIYNVSLEGGAVYYETQEGRGFVGVGDADGDAAIYDAAHYAFTKDPSGLWMDQNGGLWDLRQGLRVDAPGQLELLPNAILFWFAWHDHYPETEVWLPDAGVAGPKPQDRGIPGFGAAGAAFLLLAAVAFSRKRS